MRIIPLIGCFVTSSVLFAQVEPCLNMTARASDNNESGGPKQSLVQLATRSKVSSSLRKRSPYQPALGVSQYLFDGQSRTAPAVGMQYVPADQSAYRLTFSGGIVWIPKSSSVISDSRFTGFGRYQFVDGGVYGETLPSLMLGYAGVEYRYYLLQGEIQPYIGAGAYGLGWRYGSVSGATLAPSVMGGVNAEISTIFSGYVELRQLIGIGTFVGRSSFGGSTTVSAGFAFAPNFSSW